MKPDNAIVPSVDPEPCASPVDDASIETPPGARISPCERRQQVWPRMRRGPSQGGAFSAKHAADHRVRPTTGVTDLRGNCAGAELTRRADPASGRRHAPTSGNIIDRNHRHRSCLIGGNCDPACIAVKAASSSCFICGCCAGRESLIGQPSTRT